MPALLSSRIFHITVAVLLVVAAVYALLLVLSDPEETRVAATVERGDVRELVSVSGVVEATNLAQLGFATPGIVRTVTVDEGDGVNAGDILATLEQRALLADRQDAVATRRSAEADRDELLAGPRREAREVTSTTVAIAAETLERTKREVAEKVENARRTLLSSNLEADAVDGNEAAAPPTVTGTYTCDATGQYEIEVYRAGSQSGYAYRYRGLENGSGIATIEQPSAFGDCGLRLQFEDGESYNQSEWLIAVPNTAASTYTTNQNAYHLAQEEAENAVAAAAEQLSLAEQEATLANATPRREALARANAAVAQAEARVARVDAEIADRTLIAPFAGEVVNVDALPGESVTTEPVVTVLSADAFELTARIPEIDVTKVATGQSAQVVFDAKSDTPLTATVSFISPSATEIDGVAYYEMILELDEPPAWLRTGLNADVDIVVAEATNVLRIPRRFLITRPTGNTVLQPHDHDTATTSIDTGLIGNNGYVEITGLAEGETVLAP